MSEEEEIVTAYPFGGWDFGFSSDGNLILTIVHLGDEAGNDREKPRRISFLMPDGAVKAFGEAALRVSAMKPPLKQ